MTPCHFLNFQVIPDVADLIPPEAIPTLHLSQLKEQQELLQQVIEQSEEVGDDEIISTGIDDLNGILQRKRKPDGKMHALTPEQRAKREKDKDKGKKRNNLFKQWQK